MSSIINLKDAIQQRLMAETCLTDELDSNRIDIRTGEKNITIAEVTPNTRDQVPFVGFSVPKTIPISEYDNSGCYKSKVLFYIVTCSSAKTTVLADIVQRMLNVRPVGEDQKWFFDISNDCINSKFSKFINRVPLSPRRFDETTDVFTEVIESKFLWCACNCEGEICPIEVDDCCPNATELPDPYDLNCECD